MIQKTDIIILLGANGVGKTTIGHTLEQYFDCTFISIEAFFMSRYPTVALLQENGLQAWSEFQAQLQSLVESRQHPIIFEETATSEAGFELIEALQRRFRVVIVHVEASEATCRQRVQQRGLNNNYPKDPDFVIQRRDYFYAQVLPRLEIKLHVSNEALTPEAICQQFQLLLNLKN